MLKSYRDMPDDLVQRASKAARDRAIPPADRSTGLHALKLAQIRQQLRDGRPEAIRTALVSSGLLQPSLDQGQSSATAQSALQDVRWFVAQTKPMAEAVAIRSLVEAGFRACAPTEGKWTQLHRKDLIRVRQVFPRYVFVGLVPDRNHHFDFRSPRLCDGIAGFVEGAGKRMEVRDVEVGDLMAWSEMRWIEIIAQKAHVEMMKAVKGMSRRKLMNEGFTNAMDAILEADPVTRMRMFIERFGVKSDLRGIEKRIVSET